MASDGDHFHTRRILGFCKAFKAALAGDPAQEAAAILAAAQRALRGEYRVGALRKMVAVVLRTLAEHGESLFFSTGPAVCERMISTQLDVLERQYADQVATPEIRRVVEGLARECLLDGAKVETAAFRAQCRARLARWLVDRLHFKPTEMLVRKARGLDREHMAACQDSVFELCEAQLGRWLDEAQASTSGRLPVPVPVPSSAPMVDINSPAGLEEALV